MFSKRGFWQSFKKTLILAVFFGVLAIAIPPVVAQISTPTLIAQTQQDTSSLINQGNQLYQSGKFQEAVQVWQRIERALAEQGDYLNQAMALSNLSLAYQQLGNWNEAKDAIAQSIELLKPLARTNSQQRIYAQTLDIQGQLKQKSGQSQAALEIWQQTAKIYASIGDKNGQTISQINQAQALQDLGLYPRACKTLLKALEFDAHQCQLSAKQLEPLQQELMTLQPDSTREVGVALVGDAREGLADAERGRRGEKLFQDSESPLANMQRREAQARALRSLGNVLRVMGNLEQSQSVLTASLDIAQQWNSTQDTSKVLLNLGNTERALARREESAEEIPTAKVYSDKALISYKNAENAVSPLIRVQAQLNRLDLLIEEQQWQEINPLLSAIRESLAQLPSSRGNIYAKINLSRNLISWEQKTSQVDWGQKNFQDSNERLLAEAISLLETAFAEAKTLEDWRSQSSALGNLGKLYERIDQKNQAKIYTQEALKIAKQIRASDLAYQWQWQLGRLLKEEKNNQEAIAHYDDAINSLKNLRGDLVSLNADVQFDFREQVEPVYREYVDLLLQEQKPSQETLKIARQTIEDLQLAELDNFFQEACTTVVPKQIDEVDANTAVIYSVILPEKSQERERLEIILSLPANPSENFPDGESQGNLRHYTTSVPKQEIEKTVTELQRRLNTPLYKESDILATSEKVYDWLIRPLEADLSKSSQIKTLVFVLDGVLRNIPMAVLYDGKQYLISTDYSIALTPGLQLLDPKPLTREKFNLLGAGLSQTRTSTLSGKTYSGLPNAEEELTGIQPTEKLLDEAFTSSNLQAQVNSSSFSAVHIATHGKFSSRAENSFIFAWDGEINSNKLENLIKANSPSNLPVEILVLSACETAKGDKRAALGLAGIAVRAGARSTLASLWLVQDQTTAILMQEFYRELNQNQVTKAQALRLAQKAIRENPQFSHPYFWGAFVLVGNWL